MVRVKYDRKAKREKYTSFKPEKPVLGSQQPANRLPPPDNTDTLVAEQERACKRKKVGFDVSDNAPVETEMMTPVKQAALPAKGTPFKPQSFVEPTKSPGFSASPSPKTKFGPKPPVAFKSDPTLADKGTGVTTIGDPAYSNVSLPFDFKPLFAKNPKHRSAEHKTL